MLPEAQSGCQLKLQACTPGILLRALETLLLEGHPCLPNSPGWPGWAPRTPWVIWPTSSAFQSPAAGNSHITIFVGGGKRNHKSKLSWGPCLVTWLAMSGCLDGPRSAKEHCLRLERAHLWKSPSATSPSRGVGHLAVVVPGHTTLHQDPGPGRRAWGPRGGAWDSFPLSPRWSQCQALADVLWRDNWKWGWRARAVEHHLTLNLEFSYLTSRLVHQISSTRRTYQF